MTISIYIPPLLFWILFGFCAAFAILLLAVVCLYLLEEVMNRATRCAAFVQAIGRFMKQEKRKPEYQQMFWYRVYCKYCDWSEGRSR